MNAFNFIASISALLKAKIFKIRTPLIVSWSITNRCNMRCKYCNIWAANPEELNTNQVLSMIDELSQLGTAFIHFTGGEPLLRQDIGVILDYCHKKNILTSINSNGSFFSKRINELMNLNLLGLSLDGPKDIHDSIRGEGSYDKVLEAINIAKSKAIKTRILTVLSKSNLDTIDFILNKAKELGVSVTFQPATSLLLGGNKKNPVAPDGEKYKTVINQLIARKRKNRYIGNSLSGLKLLYYWPNPKRIKCLVNLISCRIESNGYIYICFRNQYQKSQVDRNNMTVALPFLNLPLIYCEHCCCASLVEINCLMSLKLDTIINSFRFI